MKDTGIKIHVLEKEDYFQWKVKMHLLSLDVSYVKYINKGSHVRIKLVISINPYGTIAHDSFAPKQVSEL